MGILSAKCKKAVNCIKKSPKAIILFEAPSGWGKTTVLNELRRQNEKMHIMSYETMVGIIIENKHENKADEDIIKEFCKEYTVFSLIAIEDVDFLKGKLYTCKMIAKILNNLAENGVKVIVTGCNIRNGMPELTGFLVEPQMLQYI